MIFNYYMPTRFLFGPGALDRLHKQKLPGKKALVVVSSGKSMKDGGYLDRLTEQLEKAGAAWTLFDKILPNPIVEHVNEGGDLASREGCDFIVGLGGGSTIDSAKAIAVKAANTSHDFWDFVQGSTGGRQKPENDPLPVVAVTTTAGTGTEADPWAVITKNATKEKLGYGYDKTFPALSIVDPELMTTVPPSLTAYQGFDALFHSTECYISKLANPISDVLCLDAIGNIGKYLERAVKDGGDMEAREKVALANTEAGFTQSISGCISEHAMEHALSAYSPKLPHGAGLIAISLAYYGTLIAKGALPSKFVAMAKVLGDEGASAPEDFLAALKRLQEACGVDAIRLSEYGIKEGDIPGLVKNAYDNMGDMFGLDPEEITPEDTRRIFEKSFA
ncbi:MAG: iron-containing alcohol dehydrogenase [Clostridiales Family XIII bacterium]|jgi:alcohol dehydrogenase|nr:iron-containing alcohol dehydrogenase [Clostridiales Family XIII bacterium]